MTDIPEPGGFSGLARGAAESRAALRQVEAEGARAADAVDQAFARAGESLTRSLARAASDGKLSLSEIAGAAIGAANALGRASAPGGGTLGDALAKALGGLFAGSFGGARADGGPVAPGAAYLVGERGPEVFRPASAGTMEPAATGGGVVVNVSLSGGGAPALLRSEAQIAAALARAVSLGRR